MRVNYLQPLPPPQLPPPQPRGAQGGDGTRSTAPSGEALLLERLGESVRAEDKALAADAAALDAAVTASGARDEQEAAVAAEALGGGDVDPLLMPSALDGASTVRAAEVGVKTAERALAPSALDVGTPAARQKDWGEFDIGYRDREWAEREEERLSEEAAAAAMAWEVEQEGAGNAGGGEMLEEGGIVDERERWGEWEVGEWDGANEAAEMSALAVTLRKYPE